MHDDAGMMNALVRVMVQWYCVSCDVVMLVL